MNCARKGTVAVRENGDEDGRPAIHVDHSGADSLLAEGTDDEFRRVGGPIWRHWIQN